MRNTVNTQNAKPVFDTTLFHISLGIHHDKKVIWLRFEYDKVLIQHLRNHTKALWSASQKTWYLADNKYNRRLCGLEPDIVGKEVLLKISSINLQEFEKFQKPHFVIHMFHGPDWVA